MGYRITYEQSTIKTTLPRVHRTVNLKKWIWSAAICIVLVAICTSSKVRSFLLPGDPEITEKALITLADDLKEGDSLSDAVTAFCREILDNA